jgi:hypothetical protein
MNKVILYASVLAWLIVIAGCKCYIPQKVRRDAMLEQYTALLNQVETVTGETEKKIFLKNGLKKFVKGRKARQENAAVLFKMSVSNSDSVKNFLAGICDAGFFIRTFAMDQSEMFYCFEKPNKQGLGKMYLSDRYTKGFFDEQSADNKFYIRDFNYSFPRIYFIRENEINILSGSLDLTDRKVFRRMPITGDTLFTKTATFRKNNNDEIYDLTYGFKYILYNDMEQRWKRIALSREDSSFITKDWVDYISFNSLRNIIDEKKINPASLNLVLDDTLYENHWFYAGTVTPFGEWLSNYTSLESKNDIESSITDSTRSFNIMNLIYVRQSPPGEYTSDKKKQVYKGNVSQSLDKRDKVFIEDSKFILDMKGNTSVWLQIRRVEKVEGS